jgi:anti-sigma-K factor RskA
LVAIHDPMKDFEAEVVEQLVRSEVESRVEGKLRPISTITDKNHHHR